MKQRVHFNIRNDAATFDWAPNPEMRTPWWRGGVSHELACSKRYGHELDHDSIINDQVGHVFPHDSLDSEHHCLLLRHLDRQFSFQHQRIRKDFSRNPHGCC